MYGKRFWSTVSVLAISASLAAACGDDDNANAGTGTTVEASGDTSGDTAEPGKVRLAFQPEPYIDYLDSLGVVQEMEEQWNVELEEVESYDPGPAFLGNHADVISIGTFEIAAIEEETGLQTVTFGQSASTSYLLVTKAENPAEDMADLVGQKIAIRAGGSGGLIASILAGEVYGLNFPAEGGDGGDFEVVLTDDHLVNLDLLLKGEVDAVLSNPRFAAPYLRSGELKWLSDGKFAPELLTESIGEGKKISWGNNNLVARQDWYETHPREVAFLLALYERGIEAWNSNKEDVMRLSPQEFNAEDEETLQWILDVYTNRDFIPATAYLNEEFIEGERKVLEAMKKLNLLDPDAPDPIFEIVEPTQP